MAQNFDTGRYYRKLAQNEVLSEADVVALLQAVDAYQAATAYLADCHAATLESLPKSASKSSRERYVSICRTAAALLDGNLQAIRHRSSPDSAQARCLAAANDHQSTK